MGKVPLSATNSQVLLMATETPFFLSTVCQRRQSALMTCKTPSEFIMPGATEKANSALIRFIYFYCIFKRQIQFCAREEKLILKAL